MATGWEMVPETAKALSAPFTKLIEVIAAGCGQVYRPTDIRRTARAEGDAMVILGEARGRASEVALRAAQRLLDVEERRQVNLEAITKIAEEQLPPKVSPEKVEVDWAAKFFREAQDIGNPEMRLLSHLVRAVRALGRLLADWYTVSTSIGLLDLWPSRGHTWGAAGPPHANLGIEARRHV